MLENELFAFTLFHLGINDFEHDQIDSRTLHRIELTLLLARLIKSQKFFYMELLNVWQNKNSGTPL